MGGILERGANAGVGMLTLPQQLMKSATDFIEETLDKSLEMQEVLEGPIKLNFHPFRITDCITQMLDTFHGDAAAKNLILQEDIFPRLYNVILSGDYYRIEYVIGNLLNNAIKFSEPNKKIIIKVATDCKISSRKGSRKKSLGKHALKYARRYARAYYARASFYFFE